MNLPNEIEQIILELLNLESLSWKTVRANRKRINRLKREMVQLSEDFFRRKPTEDRYPDAYFAYNFPMNLVKVMAVTKRIKIFYPLLFEKKESLNILDVGCGEGAGMLGVYYGLGESKKTLMVGLDDSKNMLKKCYTVMSRIKEKNPALSVKLLRRKISDGLIKMKEKYDIVVLANSLAEIFPQQEIPVRFIERIFKNTSEDGLVIILEPALRHTSRRLMKLRDILIRKEKFHILLPCLHNNICPLFELRKHKEWCHHSFFWNPPDYMKIIDQELNREIKLLKFSYLVLGREKPPDDYENDFLVVSRLLKEKGKKKCFLCTRNGRVELLRLNRFKSSLNNQFDEIKKGDVLTIKDYIQKKPLCWRITPATQIKIKYSLYF
ncbi:MAG TPA: methyltransferase domain-containing protein [candidate division WOR-3 bacterium]|uniref:Methyltransferase domain-containing protein n=1 Tax=candidate division WOR-3 bacterium TaxID=2052148 RepID=A0A9C9K0G3_UNCW3|nr:methyltransferase domain-containing protein [candidate division WOR-3 bacterium]